MPVKKRKLGRNAIVEAKKDLENFIKSSGKERAYDTWQKFMLIDRARKLWTDFRGDPPINTSAGAPFFEFVADLINALGENNAGRREWDTQACFNAWDKRKHLYSQIGYSFLPIYQ